MFAFGDTPARTRDPQHARKVVEREGAVILTGWGTSPDDAVAAAGAVFGGELRAVHPPGELGLHGEGAGDRPAVADGTPRHPHTDGSVLGDRQPDYILMSCAQPPADGGEYFFVDGEAVVDRLAGQRSGRDIVQRLQDVAVDHNPPGSPRSVAPIIGRTMHGRLVLQRSPHQRPAAESTDHVRDEAMIEAWSDVITIAAGAAPRVRLHPGDIAIVDNYRMMHGREEHTDVEQCIWRVWAWTTAASQLPTGPRSGDRARTSVD